MVDAAEQLVDAVTISYAPLNGQKGYIEDDYTLDGTNTASGTDAAFGLTYGCVKLGINEPLFPFGCTNYSQPFVDGTFSSGLFSFTYGEAFPLWFQLESIGGTGFGPGRPIGIGSSTADFYNTATIGGVLLYDRNMNPLSVAPNIMSELGITYQDINTPEPSTRSLCVISALALVAKRRFWGKSNRS